MADKVIFAMYDDDDKLMDGAKHLVANKVKVSDVYSPMPLHGIDSIIGVDYTVSDYLHVRVLLEPC